MANVASSGGARKPRKVISGGFVSGTKKRVSLEDASSPTPAQRRRYAQFEAYKGPKGRPRMKRKVRATRRRP